MPALHKRHWNDVPPYKRANAPFPARLFIPPGFEDFHRLATPDLT
jgi:hypothetical protein